MKAALVLAMALAAAPAVGADAPRQPNRFERAIAPAERFEIGGMLVERHGRGGRALVLIPGIAGGPWVWQDLIRRLSAEHTLYAVTLPGFDGRPAPAGAPLDAARAALKELLIARRLAQPVLVGHAMGGTLALALSQDLPAQVGGVISVNGLPVFADSEELAPAQRAAAAESIRVRMNATPPAAYAEQQRDYMVTGGMVDMGKAADATALMLRSDRSAVSAYVSALFALDLRPGLPKIAAPVLVLAPYFALDAGREGLTAPMKLEAYRRQMAGTPRLELATIDDARDFPMIDQPEAFAEAVRRFINRP